MNTTPDEILIQEIAQQAMLSGALAGALGTLPWWGVGAAGGARAASKGAAWAAKRLPLDEFTNTFETHVPLKQALSLCQNILVQHGRLIEDDANTPPQILRAIVGGGFRNLLPTLVVIVCKPLQKETGSGTQVHLYCAAKEGLIKQRAGQKTGERVLALLKQSLL